MNKFVLYYVDHCLPDYFSGHHLPVLQVVVDGATTRIDIANALFDEVKLGVLDDDQRLPGDWSWEEMKQAINKCIFWDGNCKHDDIVFPDLEVIDSDDYEYYCHAFFVIETSIEEENEE